MSMSPEQFRLDAAESLGRIEAKVTSNQDAIVRVEKKVDRINSTVSDHETRVSRIEGGIRTFKTIAMWMIPAASVMGGIIFASLRLLR